MGCEGLPEFVRNNYEIHEWQHACAILLQDFPKELQDIVEVLTKFRLLKSQIIKAGGAKSVLTSGLEKAFRDRGWKEKSFRQKMEVDGEVLEAATHKMDCFKNRVGIEIEWNSKDQTFDRDLQLFRILSTIGRLSVGVIITRSDELQPLFDKIGAEVGRKYGASTTHMGKLLPRLRSGAPCPVLAIGLTKRLFEEAL